MKVCGLVVNSHASGILTLYKHPYMKTLAIQAIEVVSQNLAFLFYYPTFLLRVLSESTIFCEWNNFLDAESDEELEKREFLITKMGKSLIHLASDPDCHLVIMHFFVQKFLDLVQKSADIHMQHEVCVVKFNIVITIRERFADH